MLVRCLGIYRRILNAAPVGLSPTGGVKDAYHPEMRGYARRAGMKLSRASQLPKLTHANQFLNCTTAW